MDNSIEDIESELINLNDKSPQEAFEIFKTEMNNVNDKDNAIIRFYQERFFMIQEGKEQITYFDVKKYDIDNFKNLRDTILEFCTKNDIEIRIIA